MSTFSQIFYTSFFHFSVMNTMEWWMVFGIHVSWSTRHECQTQLSDHRLIKTSIIQSQNSPGMNQWKCINCKCQTCTQCLEKQVPLYFLPQLCKLLTDLQNSFTVTLSRKFAIKKSLNIPPSFTHGTTLPCKTVVLKNCKLHCRPILKTFNDNEQLHNKIICSV